MSAIVELFHIPPSFYSQIVRLALCEAGVEWQDKWVIAGPPTCENYEPWFMRLNALATVPVMRVTGAGTNRTDQQESVFADSFDILQYKPIVEHFETAHSLNSNAVIEVEKWLQRHRDISVRVISYGKLQRVGGFMNRLRLKALQKRLLACQDVDLISSYQKKIEDIEGFRDQAADNQVVEAEIAKVNCWLQELDSVLDDRRFISGDQYSMADLVWTVTVARMQMIGLTPLDQRPNLSNWFKRMQDRPSYRLANIWDRAKPYQAFPILAKKYGRTWLFWLGLVVFGLWALQALIS